MSVTVKGRRRKSLKSEVGSKKYEEVDKLTGLQVGELTEN